MPSNAAPIVNGISKLFGAAVGGANPGEAEKARLMGAQAGLAQQQAGLAGTQNENAQKKQQAREILQGIMDTGGINYTPDGRLKIAPGREQDVAKFIGYATANDIDISAFHKAIVSDHEAGRDAGYKIDELKQRQLGESVNTPEGTVTTFPKGSIYTNSDVPGATGMPTPEMVQDADPTLPVADVPQSPLAAAAGAQAPRVGTQIGAASPNQIVNPKAPKETRDPAAIAKAKAENESSIRMIDAAIAALDKNPDAVGLKNIAGNAIAQRLPSWLAGSPTEFRGGNADNNMSTLAAMGGVAAIRRHAMFGSALSAGEKSLSQEFIPQSTDTPTTARNKLIGMRNQVESDQKSLDDALSGIGVNQNQGASPLAQAAGAGQQPAAQSGPVKINDDAQFDALPSGTQFMGPDGVLRVKP